MIQGYPDRPSILPGKELTLHISTLNEGGLFNVDFYRQGTMLEHKGSLKAQTGHHFEPGPPDQDWGWHGYTFQIPDNWESGVYIAMFTEFDQQGNPINSLDRNTADGRDAKALFVVKSLAPGQSTNILYKLPLFTYHAYNYTGGGSLYRRSSYLVPVTLRRPGGGTGGLTSYSAWPDPGDGDIDDYDPSSPRQTFAHWEVPFIRWLEKNRYQVDYCTDLDLHEDPNLLTPYHLVLSVGHDEYWSDDMYAHVEAFINNGGNVAFFSGNVCYWHIVYDEKGMSFNNDYGWWGAPLFRYTKVKIPRPDTALTGVSYTYGGGFWYRHISDYPPDPTPVVRPPIGYKVQHSDHWVYENTKLQDGEVFGDYYDQAQQDPAAIVGYECDGTLFDDSTGFAIPIRQPGTPSEYTPSNFTILGYSTPLVSNIHPWSLQAPVCIEQCQDESKATKVPFPAVMHATMGIYSHPSGGIVFTAATVDWARVLASGKEPRVEQITRNVIEHLKPRAVRIMGRFPRICGVNVAVVCNPPSEAQKDGGGVKRPPKQDCLPVKFQVDTLGLPNQQNLHYQWTISGGSGVSLDQPTFEATMPAVPVPVTVTVTINDGTDRSAFGTLTFTPLSQQEYLLFQFGCRLRELYQFRPRPRDPEQTWGVGDGDRFFEGDRFFVDPLRGGLRTPLTPQGLQEIARGAEQLAELAKQLLRVQEG